MARLLRPPTASRATSRSRAVSGSTPAPRESTGECSPPARWARSTDRCAAALHEYQHLERALDGEPGRPARVGSLLSELAGLVSRQRALIAELDALGVSRPPPVHLGVVA